MKRAVLYLRLSAIVEDSTSIARQEADLRALCEREGWSIVGVLTDDGKSGRKARANASEALRMLRDGEADVLAVWKLDRFTRQGLGAIGDLVDTLDSTPGSLFVALQDGLRSDQAAWRLVAAVLSEVARSEADNTATRARSAIKYRKTVTHRFTGGGTIPFGYASAPAPDGVGRVLVPDPLEAAIVREVAGRLLAEEPVTRIAADLTERGVATSKSPARKARYRGEDDSGLDRGRWSVSTVRSLWTADLLLGRVSVGKDVVRDDDGLPIAVWPPLLDLATVSRLRDLFGERDPSRRPRRRSRLLSGVAYCAYCEAKLYVTTSGGRPIYRCPGNWNGDTAHPSVAIDALQLEEYITARFLTGSGPSPEVELVRDPTDPGTEQALAEVEASLREASTALLDDDADAPALLRRIDALKARRADLRALPATVTAQYVQTGRTLAEAWHASDDLDYRRTVLVQALDHVKISTGKRGRKGLDEQRVAPIWYS